MARNGPPGMSAQWSLSGGKQTWGGLTISVAIDPKATSLDRPWEYRKDAPVNRAEGALMQSKMASWAFVLAISDINKSAEYFRDFLGFVGSATDAADTSP